MFFMKITMEPIQLGKALKAVRVGNMNAYTRTEEAYIRTRLYGMFFKLPDNFFFLLESKSLYKYRI